MTVEHHVKKLELATGGRYRIEWAEQEMPVLRSIKKQFKDTQPLKGLRISACLHVTTETANLMRTLQGRRRLRVVCVEAVEHTG
jgi:adenosylhomocysteinase